MALHRGLDGELLPAHVAAVELLNLLRPTVAVAVYVAFVGLALYRNPHCHEATRSGGPGELERFVLTRGCGRRPAAGFLAGEICYGVPAQDLRVDETRLPALPRSGFEIHQVKLV